jgi:hypothetical protein
MTGTQRLKYRLILEGLQAFRLLVESTTLFLLLSEVLWQIFCCITASNVRRVILIVGSINSSRMLLFVDVVFIIVRGSAGGLIPGLVVP